MSKYKASPKGQKNAIKNGEVVNETFVVFSCLGQGGFASVYEVFDLRKKDIYALKIELANQNQNQDENESGLQAETVALNSLQHSCRFPRFVESGKLGEQKYLAMQLLGRNLNDLRKACPDNRFTLNSATRLAVQCLTCLEELHASGFLHRDIKPNNYAIGSKTLEQTTVHLFDFGFVRKFRLKPDQVRNQRPAIGFRGTIKYASVNAHKRQDLGRNDDLCSWFYTIAEFMKGELPWQKESDANKVTDIKQSMKDALLKDLQPEMTKLFEAIQKLTFTDDPSYHAMKSFLYDVAQRKGFSSTDPYDWEQGGAYRNVLKTLVTPANRKKEKAAALKKAKEKKSEETSTEETDETSSAD